MNYNPEIPKNILKDYFVLRDEINKASRLNSLEAFDVKTFDAECEQNRSAKFIFYLFTGLSIGLLLSTPKFAYLTYEHLLIVRNSSAFEINERVSDISWRFSALISALFLVASGFCSYKAYKAFNSFNGDERSRLLAKAHHPGVAKQIYNAVEVILKKRIPIHTIKNHRVCEFPIHPSVFNSRRSAMLVLLGDESHRLALWKDGSIPKGPILVDRKYWKEIIGGLEQSIRALEKTSKDERDPRFLVTALLFEEHMKTSFDVMGSDHFWRGKRKSQKSKTIESIVKILLEDWNIWEGFRQNITGNFTSATYKDNKFHNFAEKLFEVNKRNTAELIGILTGEDRTARKYFRSLNAISEQDLVARSTNIK